MEDEVVLYQTEGKICHIILNRPQVINAFNRAMYEQLNAALNRFRDDDKVWVAIISGRGERGFCAGVDIKSIEVDENGVSIPFPPIELCDNMVTPKPIVAAIHGHCIGEGANVAFSCDMIFAAENSKVYLPEARIGVNALDLPLKLARKVNYNHAFELLMGLEAKSAEWCINAGLVNQVTPNGKVVEAAKAWAQSLLDSTAPLAIRGMKETLHRAVFDSETAGLAVGQLWREKILHSQDWIEGQQAFKEKRRPKYDGR